MKTLYSDEFNIVRKIFIETLNHEFTSKTEFGAYAHLSPNKVNHLFKDYLKQNSPIDDFVRHSVKEHINRLGKENSI